jgi:hypothetical protein
MLHKKLFSLVLLVIALLSFGVVTMAQDDVLVLPVLLDGDTVEDVLSLDVQARIYVFNANEGDEVTVSMVQTDDALDPYLALFGPSGELIAVNDDVDIENGDLSSLIEEVVVPETGSYFVIASSYEYVSTLVELEEDVEGELGFELSVSGMTPVEDMDSDFLFFAADLLPDESLEADISVEQNAWYFLFQGSAGDVVNLEAVSDDFDTIIHVFAPGGARLAVNDDIDREGGDYNSALEDLELPEDGLYLVIVSNPFVFQPGQETELDDETLYGTFTVGLTGATGGTEK